ncbi:MAG: glutamate--tRNA ligase family protein, partial [Burkholderiales bacterium]
LRVSDSSLDFKDWLQGRVTRHLARDIGDFVVYRADHVYAYHLACAVDDAEQGVTDVVRGADLIDSTPRQIYLQQLLGLSTPAYLHLPVALSDSGMKLSKQTLAQPVDMHCPAKTIHAVLGFLGQQPPAELARLTPREAMQFAQRHWSRERLPHAIALRAARGHTATGVP